MNYDIDEMKGTVALGFCTFLTGAFVLSLCILMLRIVNGPNDEITFLNNTRKKIENKLHGIDTLHDSLIDQINTGIPDNRKIVLMNRVQNLVLEKNEYISQLYAVNASIDLVRHSSHQGKRKIISHIKGKWYILFDVAIFFVSAGLSWTAYFIFSDILYVLATALYILVPIVDWLYTTSDHYNILLSTFQKIVVVWSPTIIGFICILSFVIIYFAFPEDVGDD